MKSAAVQLKRKPWFGFKFAMIFVAIHLFTTHSKLLWHLNPDMTLQASNVFDFTNIYVANMIAMVLSISYSIATVIIIKEVHLSFAKIWTFLLISWFAIIDGIGIWIYYMSLPNIRIWASIYYGVYTFSIICAFGLHQAYSESRPVVIANNAFSNSNLEQINDLRQKMYSRKKKLKYSGGNIENDEVLNEMKKQIDKLKNE